MPLAPNIHSSLRSNRLFSLKCLCHHHMQAKTIWSPLVIYRHLCLQTLTRTQTDLLGMCPQVDVQICSSVVFQTRNLYCLSFHFSDLAFFTNICDMIVAMTTRLFSF